MLMCANEGPTEATHPSRTTVWFNSCRDIKEASMALEGVKLSSAAFQKVLIKLQARDQPGYSVVQVVAIQIYIGVPPDPPPPLSPFIPDHQQQ